MALITKLSTCIIGQDAVISTEGSSTSGTGRYSIEYEFGELTGVIVDNLPASGIPAKITWTVPMVFSKQFPYATSKTGKLISYYTFAGKKDVNYTSTFTAKIADDAVPTIESTVATTDAISSQLSGNTNTIISGVSTVQINLYATPTTGAYIKDKWCQNPPNYYSGKHGTTQTFIGHNNGVFKFGATDTRNRSATKTITLAAIDYRSPTISIDGIEINTSGVATIDISGTWFKGSFGKVSNDITVSYRYKPNSSSSWGSWTTIPNAAKNNDGTFSATVTKSGLSYTETYNFEARVQDAINTVSSKEYIAKSLPVFDWSADDFNFNVPVSVLPPTDSNNPATKQYVDNTVSTLTEKFASIINIVYPVGSIYMSVNAADPSTLFSGTSWEKLEGRFLLGSDSTYNPGSTGGEATHTLTLNEMPGHYHEGLYYSYQDTENLVTLNGGTASYRVPWGSSSYPGDYGAGTGEAELITGEAGGGAAHNNMPPYLVVNMWKRTS